MILIIGGAYQGKKAFAESLKAGTDIPIWADLQDWVKEQLKQEKVPAREIRSWLAEHPEGILVCNEVGSGIVPMDPLDRDWREATGRLCCDLAKEAEAVYRVNCGIGIRIK